MVLAHALAPLTAQAGYTHYWTWHKKPDPGALRDCVADMRRLIDARRAMLDLTPSTTEVSPERVIEFNGIDEDAHEPFYFPGEVGFNFCKTQWKPYDAVVVACLLAAADHFAPDVLEIRSDGIWEEGDWQPGASLYESVLHRPVRNPMQVRRTPRRNGTNDDDGDNDDGTRMLPGYPPLPAVPKMPTGERARNLAISIGLLMLGVALYYTLPLVLLILQCDFSVRIADDRVKVRGRLSPGALRQLHAFFDNDFPRKRNLRVFGRFRENRRIDLHFVGPASPGEQQRVRNFVQMYLARSCVI